jgi:hypothetical protein
MAVTFQEKDPLRSFRAQAEVPPRPARIPQWHYLEHNFSVYIIISQTNLGIPSPDLGFSSIKLGNMLFCEEFTFLTYK